MESPQIKHNKITKFVCSFLGDLETSVGIQASKEFLDELKDASKAFEDYINWNLVCPGKEWIK